MANQMTRSDRLGFLWMSSIATRKVSGLIDHDIRDIERVPLPELQDSENSWDQFARETLDIGKAIAAEGGFKAMVETLDAFELFWGLNAGEWLARRWDGIETKEGSTWNA